MFQFPGCQEACRFHAEASTRAQQTQPVIHTKDEGVIRVNGALALWPRPSSVGPATPLVYVVMRKSRSGPWRQIIQTLDLTTRVPLNSDRAGSTLRVLVVDPQGLVTIYSPDESLARENRKRKKTINTEIKATTSKSTYGDSPWVLKEISLIHQKVLVIGEIAWEPKTTRGVYLVTWEVDGGGLKGNLFTDSTCVTLSLWPDTVYHIQVELVSRTPGVENLKSEMMDLDTGRAQRVSTESQEDLNMISDEAREDVDFNSPLLSVLVGAVKGEKTRRRWYNMELIMGSCAAVLLFSIIMIINFWRCRRRGSVIDNMITGSSTVRSHKLVEDVYDYAGKKVAPSLMFCSQVIRISRFRFPANNDGHWRHRRQNETNGRPLSAGRGLLSRTQRQCRRRRPEGREDLEERSGVTPQLRRDRHVTRQARGLVLQ